MFIYEYMTNVTLQLYVCIMSKCTLLSCIFKEKKIKTSSTQKKTKQKKGWGYSPMVKCPWAQFPVQENKNKNPKEKDSGHSEEPLSSKTLPDRIFALSPFCPCMFFLELIIALQQRIQKLM